MADAPASSNGNGNGSVYSRVPIGFLLGGLTVVGLGFVAPVLDKINGVREEVRLLVEAVRDEVRLRADVESRSRETLDATLQREMRLLIDTLQARVVALESWKTETAGNRFTSRDGDLLRAEIERLRTQIDALRNAGK